MIEAPCAALINRRDENWPHSPIECEGVSGPQESLEGQIEAPEAILDPSARGPSTSASHKPNIAEPNRPALVRSLRLRADAGDAEIIAAIREIARTFRGMGRPFVLPRNLDLAGVLDAVHSRKLDEVQHSRRNARELMKINERQFNLSLRCMALDFILDVNGTPISPMEEP